MADGDDVDLAEAQRELEELRAENEKLREGRSPTRWIRSTAVVVLFALAALLIPTAGIAVWARNTILHTDRYVETVAPLAEEPAVIDAVSDRLTTAIFERIDVQSELEQYLPPRLSFAAGPLASQVESTTNDLIVKALQTPEFANLWKEVNRVTSEALVAYVNGDASSAVTIKGDQLVLNLGPVLASVKQTLVSQGFSLADKIPSTTATVEMQIGDVSALVELKSALRTLNTLAYVLPILALICLVAAVVLMRDRRRGVMWAGIILAGSALFMALALALGRESYLNAAVDGGANQQTAAIIFDTLVRFLRNGIRVFFLLGVVLAIGAVITGPTAWAVRTRSTIGGLITSGGERTGWDSGAFGAFFARHRLGLMGLAAVLMAVWLFLLDQPTPGAVLWLTIGLLVLLAVIQFVAATAPRDATAAGAEPEAVEAGAEAGNGDDSDTKPIEV